MNKERAREILKYMKEPIGFDENNDYSKEEISEALDIAIESLQQEKDFYDLLQDRIDYYDDLITKTENLDVRATYCGTYDELIYILNLTKKVEPYERKE